MRKSTTRRVNRKRVSRKRVSRKRVSRRRMSRKRVSRRRVSRKRVSPFRAQRSALSRRRLNYKITGKIYPTLGGATAFPSISYGTKRFLEREWFNIGFLLYDAIKNNDIELIEYFLNDRSININRDYIPGRNALSDSYIYLVRPARMAKILLKYGALANPTDPIIAKAIITLPRCDIELLISLLKAGGNPNIPLDTHVHPQWSRISKGVDSMGDNPWTDVIYQLHKYLPGPFTPLMYIVFIINNTSIRNSFIKVLLDFGADTNYKTKNGTTVLFLALLDGRDPSTIKLLLDSGADPNIEIPAFLAAEEYPSWHRGIAYSRQIKKMLNEYKSKLRSRCVDTMRMIYALRSKDRALTRSLPGDNVRNALDIITDPNLPEDLRNLILIQAGLKKSHRGLDALVRKYYAKHRPPVYTWEWDRNKRIDLGAKLDSWTKDDDRRTKALVDTGLPLTGRGREKMSRGDNTATQAQIEELEKELATFSLFGSDDSSD